MKSPSALRLIAPAFALVAGLFATSLQVRAASTDYSVLTRFSVSGNAADGFDYLRADSVARRLYVTRQKRVEVLDLDSGKKVGEITGLSRAHGVAISTETGHGFASSGIDDQITMFDLKTLATIKTIKSTGSNPDAIEYDSGTKRVYAANHSSGEITVLDPATGDVVGTVKFGEGKLEGLAFDGRGQGFVLAEDKSSVFVFDLKTLQPKAKWSAAPAEGGTGIACDPETHRLFLACANNMMAVLDSDTGKVIATPAIAEDPDAIAYDAATKRVFVPCVDGTLSIVQQQSADKYVLLQNVPTQKGCRTIAFDAKTGRAFTCSPKYGPAPAPVKGGPKPKPAILPDSFEVLVVGVK